MNKYIFFIVGLIFITSNIYGQRKKPAWISYEKRAFLYPEKKYIIGFISEKKKDYENLNEINERLINYCKNIAVSSVHSSIKSQTNIVIESKNEESNEYFKQMSVSMSKMDIVGLQTKTYYDERKKECYALVYANKQNLITSYNHKINTNITNIKFEYETAKSNQSKDISLKNLYNIQPKIRETEELCIIMFALMGGTDSELLKKLNSLKINVNNEIQSIKKSNNLSLEEAVTIFTSIIKAQLKTKNQSLSIRNFTYQDTEVSSKFAKHLRFELESELVKNDFNVIESNEDSKSILNLVGTYWLKDDGVKIIGIIRNQKTGKAEASAEIMVSKLWIDKNNIEVQPQNLKKLYEELNLLTENQILSVGGLYIDLLTNKGAENLIFYENEIVKLFIKANQSCYTRFIYHLADGNKVMLLDNFVVSEDNINKLIQVEPEFYCAPPFGIEALQLIAQTKPFKPVKTYTVDGYTFIDEELETFLEKTRGFKPKEEGEGKAERILIITTMQR